MTSRPSWARGLKYGKRSGLTRCRVAPLVGAWIEIILRRHDPPVRRVAPLVGAWIEIEDYLTNTAECLSRPSWARGLK